MLLHRSRLAAHVHEDDRHAAAGGQRAHGGVRAQRSDIVDHVRPGVQRHLRHVRLHRIDGDGDIAPAPDLFDDRNDALDLRFLGHRLGAGSGRLAADVDDRRAVRLHPQRRINRLGSIEVHAAFGEGVGRHVDDAHDRGSADAKGSPSWEAKG